MRQETALAILKTGRNVFLTGPAGTGKTHVLNQYIAYLQEHHIPYAVTASTGIAATHLGGETIHRFSGIGARSRLSEWDLDALTQKEALVRRLNKVAVVIVDEVSMLSAAFIDTLDLVLKTVRQNSAPFGGVQMVFAGDFFQLPPVSDPAFAFESFAWQQGDIRVCYLHEQFRQTDAALATILADMRRGAVEQAEQLLHTRLHASLPSVPEPVHLYTHNQDVDAYNSKKLASLSGKQYVFEAKRQGSKAAQEALLRGMLAPEQLFLKEGAVVMFVKNDPQGRYVNGTVGVVSRFSGGLPVVQTKEGKEIIAEPQSWVYEQDGKRKAEIVQVPLRLAWAMTVHKSQGMTIDLVRADLSSAFVPGQGYVALSRVRMLEGLSLLGIAPQALAMEPRVLAFDQVLQKESAHWERVFEGFSTEKKQALQEAFLEKHAGSATAPDTLTQTKKLLQQGLSLEEVASKRELSVETIITHLEKLKQRGELVQKWLPELPEDTVAKVVAAAAEVGWERLAPLKQKVPEADYHTIRLIRLREG